MRRILLLVILFASAIAGFSKKSGYLLFEFGIRRDNAIEKKVFDQIPHKRDDIYVAETFVLANQATIYYYMNVSLGTPPQNFSVQIDSGSSDFWVYSKANPYCGDPNVFCEGNVFDPGKSSSFYNVNKRFLTSYADSTFAQGNISQDVMTVGLYVLDNFTFGLATEANSSLPVLGLGFSGRLATLLDYENFPARLVSSGYIPRTLYSLWLGDAESAQGTVLFGGVDRARFWDNITQVQMLNTDGDKPIAFYTTLDSMSIISVTNNSGLSNISTIKYPALMDSGTSQFVVPKQVFDNLGVAFNGISYIEHLQGYAALCSVLDRLALNITFSGQEFSIPLSMLGMPIPEQVAYNLLAKSSLEPSEDKNDYCALNVATLTGWENQYIVGDALLRYFYIVYDLDHYSIGLAPSRLNAQDNDIALVQGKKIPFATKAPGYSNTFVSTNTSLPNAEETTLTGVVPTGITHLRNLNQQFINPPLSIAKGWIIAIVVICLISLINTVLILL